MTDLNQLTNEQLLKEFHEQKRVLELGNISNKLRDDTEARISVLHDLIEKRDLQEKIDEPSSVSGYAEKHGNSKTSWTAEELLNATFEEPEWIVDGLVPVGLTLMAAKPKTGKSYLGLQIAGNLGSGNKFFNRKLNKAKVLFIALEDNKQRLKKRLKEQQWSKDADVMFELKWPKLDKGGLEQLEEAIKENGYKLIIIDTLSRIANFKQLEIEESTNIMDSLQQLAFTYNCGILVIDHHKKPQVGSVANVINDVLGSTGKTAVADNIIGIYRKEGEQRAELKTVSRDQDFVNFIIEMDTKTMTWELIGNAAEIITNERHKKIVEVIKDMEQATFSEIRERIDILKGTLSKDLKRLKEQRLIEQEGMGKDSKYKLVS